MAQSAKDDPEPEPATGEPEEDPRQHIFEVPGPEDGAIAYEDQPPEEQALIDQMNEAIETQQGYEVHQAWSRAARSEVARARAHRAELDAALSDADTLGVE